MIIIIKKQYRKCWQGYDKIETLYIAGGDVKGEVAIENSSLNVHSIIVHNPKQKQLKCPSTENE